MELHKIALIALALVAVGGCRLTVGVSGDGKVTSDDSKLDCPSDCKMKLKRGKDVTLQAVANDGSFFASWKGCDSETDDLCTVVGRNRNRKVTAVFSENSTLADAEISADLLACALSTDSGYTETSTVDSVIKLVCDGSDTESYGSSFDVSGIEVLANLTWVDISNGDLGTTTAFPKLSKLETLKLRGQNLTDVSPLLELNVETLATLDLLENPAIDCNDVAELEEKFVGASILAPDTCN